ncbi:MAG: hypoxanthine phosphoribosyltransferase, partial [Proteobacteria bacterium]|nr:hypoxanthine phosphoribosyltransferase [Pseudomonadota bacterium]
LDGLTIDEIKENKPAVKDLIDKISPIINQDK